MPPVRTTVSCPNCRQPVQATLEQVFDVAQDPSAKQRFMSGRFNVINCPNCRYQGQVATPVLYHDPQRELLMTFVPMELGLPQAEQEKLIGRMLNEVINKLPQEQRKAYLLSPKPAFTLQGMIERVLEAEGITKEMLDAQRGKVQLLQQLLQAPEDQWPEQIKQHDAEVDATLVQLLSGSAQATAAGGNPGGAEKMEALLNALVQHSSFGQQLRQRQDVLQAVARELQALGQKLTPDKLLELVTKTDDEDRLAAYVSYARPGMDYAFFEALTRRIDKAPPSEKERLTRIREKLLQLTQQVDQATQARMAEATELLQELLNAPDPRRAIAENLPQIDETFLTVLSLNVEAAERAKRKDVVERLTRLNDEIMAVMQAAAPPELQFINDLLQMETDEQALDTLKRQPERVNQELIDTMAYVQESLRRGGDGQPGLAERLDKLRAAAVGELMRANWQRQ
jgi:hypothetical protein